MDELSEKVDKVLSSIAATPGVTEPPPKRRGTHQVVLVKLKDGAQEKVHLSANMRLGIGDDRDKIAELLRKQGKDVVSVELPGSIPYKEVLGWSEALSTSFTKAWIQRVDLIEFVEKVCYCGEGLVKYKQYDLAFTEVFDRFADRMLNLKKQISENSDEPDPMEKRIRAVGACVRFFLGRCVSLYQRTIKRDPGAKRPDTINALREVLKDITVAVQFLNVQDETIREALYWAAYNASVLAKRVARWMRLHGFGGSCVPALWWLAQASNTCLPMMAVHILPVRLRFFLELIYCAESAQQLVEAQNICALALEQVEQVQKIEDMLKPVPQETVSMLGNALTRIKVMKIKYDFWLGKVADAKQVSTLSEDLGPNSSMVVPCLVEAMHVQHGLPQFFGATEAAAEDDAAPDAAAADGGPEVTKFNKDDVAAKQRQLLDAIMEKVKPHLETAGEAVKSLEEHTKKRLAYEQDVDRRAAEDDDGPAEDGAEKPTAPTDPDDEMLTSMGMNIELGCHMIEDFLPLSAHAALARECLRLAMRSADEGLVNEFESLQTSLALRLRYRHFLRPPLTHVDVIVTPEKNKDKVALPDGYVLLSGDLNVHSLRNRQIELEEKDEPDDPTIVKKWNPALANKPQGQHIYIIGSRYNAWKNWVSEYPTPMRRICNLRVTFSSKPPSLSAASSVKSFGFFDPMPMDGSQPWMESYRSANACDSSGFSHSDEALQEKDLLMQQLVASGHATQAWKALPIEPHPGNVAAGGSKTGGADISPYLTYCVYDEQAVWDQDDQVRQMRKRQSNDQNLTILSPPSGEPEDPGEAAAPPGEPEEPAAPTIEELLLPWCCLLDDANVSLMPISDVSTVTTKQLHASVPKRHFNAMVRADLKQTPGELLGRPFQSYIFLCAAVESPSSAFIGKHLRLMHTFHLLYQVKLAVVGADGSEAVGEAVGHSPDLVSRLLEMSHCLTNLLQGSNGQLFLLDAADLLEDVCSYIFSKIVWPKLQDIQQRLQKHEVLERIINDTERAELAEWSAAIREILPMLLRTLENVHAIDAMMIGSVASALSKLFIEENDPRGAQEQLGMAIARLEDELAEISILGPQPHMDRGVAASISFDPPGIRASRFELYDNSEEAVHKDATLLLHGLPKYEQEQFCLLTHLYEQWIDCSLKVHLKNVSSTIKRAKKPGEAVDDSMAHVVTESASTKLALSNQEADVLARLGENSYLRSLFFVAVARRRPDVAITALGKACQEVETAAIRETELWEFFEHDLVRQQNKLRTGASFSTEFQTKAKAKKKKAHPALLYGRSPYAIRLRAPPLIGASVPPVLPSAGELKPKPMEYTESEHSQQLGLRSNTTIVLTCGVYGKDVGTGTSVSDMHRALPGTGMRLAGNEYVEITGLRPNTNYCFATMYYEGFEATRPAVSAISETSPPIGTYYPLPHVLLRIAICHATIDLGLSAAPVWGRAWSALFEKLCERTHPAEEFDSCGVRTFKLRLEVADRMPPSILAAFAQIILKKNQYVGSGSKFPSTRPAQSTLLRSANECLVAVDSASRAGNNLLTLQAVSLTLSLVARLLQYRTKPHVLLTLLTKCGASLEAMKLSQTNLAWYAHARIMSTYLFHNIAVLCVQLRRSAVLAKQLDGDSHERYAGHELAESAALQSASARVLDASLELALLGDMGWSRAEGKAKAALNGQSNAEDLERLLKEFSQRNYTAVLTEAAALSLNEDEAKRPGALSFMQCAATRAWEQGGVEEVLADVLGKHPLGAILNKFLGERGGRFIQFGFMLRAQPPAKLAYEEKEGDDESEAPGPAAGAEEADAAEDGEEKLTEPQMIERLSQHGDTAALAQLELVQAAPLLQELCQLKVHFHDITRFQFFDLDQISVPELPPDGQDTQGFSRSLSATDADPVEAAAEGEEEKELPEWEVKENETRESRKRGFEILQKLMRHIARAAAYASAKRADQILQMACISALNALLIVGPAPEECVPPGPKSNPADLYPDGEPRPPSVEKVEGEEEAAPAADAEETPEPENDIWLNMALLAELAVECLLRLKNDLASVPEALVVVEPATQKFAPPERTSTSKEPAGTQKAEDEEVRVIRVAHEVSRAMESADEELHDVWFEARPDLDVTSMAKVVGFAVLCLYHMRRWDNVNVLCRTFNDATCSQYATTFLPLAIGAQKEVCGLSKNAIGHTRRFISEAEKEFEVEKEKIPRKVRRQLALQGALSPPEKLWRFRKAHYDDVLRRQNKLDEAWALLMRTVETSYSLVTKAVPAAMKQLRESRILLADFLQDKQAFSMDVRAGKLSKGELVGRQRLLKLKSATLTSSYRKSVELLKKRQMVDQVVQALHELGNLQWLEGESEGAQTSWSDAVDVTFQYVYSIKNWQGCLESAVSPPQDSRRVESMLLVVPILAKYARFGRPGYATGHLHAALFASGIIEAVLTSCLPHPSHRALFSPDQYRMREIFFGFRESHKLLPPNSVHGGLDGLTFLGSLEFFHNSILLAAYQPSRCLPICALYNYIATDICRNRRLAVKGRLMMARALIKCKEFSSAWFTMHAVANNLDMPRSPLVSEVLDRAILEVQVVSETVPYRTHEAPFTETNMKAANQLAEFAMAPLGSVEAAEAFGMQNVNVFDFLKAEFLVSICSHGRVFQKLSDQEEKDRIAWLDKADSSLKNLWSQITGNDDDLEAWSTSLQSAETPPKSMQEPSRTLNEDESRLCIEIRMLRSVIWELRGDLPHAVSEVIYSMHFMQLLGKAGAASEGVEGVGEPKMRGGCPDMKVWMMLRRRLVNLLVSQGRVLAAARHIEKGMQECAQVKDDLTRVELLAARVRIEVLQGKILDMTGQKQAGAIATAEQCLSVTSRSFPIPIPSAISTRMVLVLLLEQNPALKSNITSSADLPAPAVAAGKAKGDADSADPKDFMSLVAQSFQSKAKVAPTLEDYRARQLSLIDLVTQCAEDVDALLRVHGFELQPPDRNHLLNVRLDDSEDAAPDAAAAGELKVPLLPALVRKMREKTESDARAYPNIYMELMPMLCQYELILARLRLDLGDMEVEDRRSGASKVGNLTLVRRILQDAEARMAQCVHLIPWLHVQFCMLKLKWRRLDLKVGEASRTAPPPPTNHAKFRDPKTFANGVCPPTSSPVFRTFLRRARAPPLTDDAEWDLVGPPGTTIPLDKFLQELLTVVRVAKLEGGHDYVQLRSLFREGIEEVLRVCAGKVQKVGEDLTSYDQLHSLFACLAAVEDSRKALLFELDEAPKAAAPDPKAGKGGAAAGSPAAPGPVDAAALPPRIALDIQQHLKRQAHEGALAYSAAAQQDSKKSILFQAVLKHSAALRRECDTFASIHLADRLLCDQLHVALSQASDAYLKAKILNDELLQAVETPVATPQSGDIIIHWMHPEPYLGLLPSEHCAFMVFSCPQPEDQHVNQPFVARVEDARRPSVRSLLDSLGADLDHCRPAATVTGEYMEQRLRMVARELRGTAVGGRLDEEGDPVLDKAVISLLLSLCEESEEPASPVAAPPEGEAPAEVEEVPCPELVSAAKVQQLLKALVRLLDVSNHTARVHHDELNRFLRVVLGPFATFPAEKWGGDF